MLKNYFKAALRNLRHNKINSFINIAGLSLGLASAMLIILYLKDEVSFDRFHRNVAGIYRIVSTEKYKGTEYKNTNTGLLQGPRFMQNVPGIKSFVRVQSGVEDIKQGTEVLSQDLLYVDSNFFSVFTFPLIEGDAKNCLKQPHSIVLSEDAAKKQFGTAGALGKMVQVKENGAFVAYKVTAVTKDCPQNSSIQFKTLLPIDEPEADAKNNDNWFSFFLNTFVVLNPNANPQTVSGQMQRFYIKDASQTFKELEAKYGSGGTMDNYFLQPFTDMHLNTELSAQNGLVNGSNPMYSYILSGIALFILLIACINFINLTVARSVRRAKEIGIRKVVGSGRKQLIFQLLGESYLLCTIAFLFAILLAQLILPVFNDLSNKQLSISYLLDAKLVAGYIILFMLTGLLAGAYPALVLSGYKPVEILYNRFNLKGKNYLQKSLVVLQFTLASFLIIATLTIYVQFNFLTKTNLGYDDNNVVDVSNYNLNHDKAAAFKAELLRNPNIVDAAPNDVGRGWTVARVANDSNISFNYATIDESYFHELAIPILQGRNFSKAFPADSNNSVIVNESFVKLAGWKNPVGEKVNFWSRHKIYHVIGVVQDYHFQSLAQKIGPQLFTTKNDNHYATVLIKIKPNTATASLKYIQQTFKQLFPMNPYSYTFLNDENRKNYEAEDKWKQIMLFSAVLTIFISSIGLFGLSVLSAEKRTKEIGIRKVLGASVSNVVSILSIDFLKLVAIALVISLPAGWLAANKWLENYPYRTSLHWWIFSVTALLVIFIALITVSFQSVKTAIANPVKSLRTE